MDAPMMDVISRSQWMPVVPTNQDKTEMGVVTVDVVPVLDQEDVDAGLHLDPGPGTAGVDLLPDPDLVIVSADPAVGARGQLLAAVAVVGHKQMNNVDLGDLWSHDPCIFSLLFGHITTAGKVFLVLYIFLRPFLIILITLIFF